MEFLGILVILVLVGGIVWSRNKKRSGSSGSTGGGFDRETPKNREK
jgi:hypothetical protein